MIVQNHDFRIGAIVAEGRGEDRTPLSGPADIKIRPSERGSVVAV